MNKISEYTILESHDLRNLEDQIHLFLYDHKQNDNLFKINSTSYSTTTIKDKIHYSVLLSHSQIPSTKS